MADSEAALPKTFVPLNLPHAASILSFPLGLRSVPSILGAGRAQLMPAAAACPPGRKPPPHAGHSGSLCIGAEKESQTGTAPDSQSDDPGEGEGRGQEKAMRMAAGTVLVLQAAECSPHRRAQVRRFMTRICVSPLCPYSALSLSLCSCPSIAAP